MTRTRVKICGITSIGDAAAAAGCGADAIGLNFWPGSARYVEPAVAAGIVAGLAPMVTSVGVFVDPTEDEVRGVLESVALDMLQFHGDESPGDCERFGRPYIKALRVRPGVDVRDTARRHGYARALLLDTYRAGRPGGTGESFDWSLIPDDPGLPLILAGGLNGSNVAEAIARVRPYCVDVSGGVESAPGVKDAAKMQAFMREVAGASTTQ